MGVERAVTRWYALRQTIQQELDALQSKLEPPQAEGQPEPDRVETERQLAAVQARLQTLGPCPKAMMG